MISIISTLIDLNRNNSQNQESLSKFIDSVNSLLNLTTTTTTTNEDDINVQINQYNLNLYQNYFKLLSSNNPYHFSEFFNILQSKFKKVYIYFLVNSFENINGSATNFKYFIINTLISFIESNKDNNNNTNIDEFQIIDISSIKNFSEQNRRDLVLCKKVNYIENHLKGSLTKDGNNNTQDDSFLSTFHIFYKFTKFIDESFNLEFLCETDIDNLINEINFKNGTDTNFNNIKSFLNSLEKSTLEFITLDVKYLIQHNYNNSNTHKYRFYLYCIEKRVN